MESKTSAFDEKGDASSHAVPNGVDPLFFALSRLQRRRYDECVNICSDLLAHNPYDKAVWFLKCRALTLSTYIDDTELEEEGIADVLMDENAIAQAPRPGTSFTQSSHQSNSSSASMRPLTSSGRPNTGFLRPGTASSSKKGSVESAFRGGRPGTSRPTTALGRFIRLGTASMLASQGQGPFINVDSLPLKKYASRPALGKALCDYLVYHEHNPKKALELAAEATVASGYNDWWWKARLGKCYYQLGLYRDAEKQFKSSLNEQDMIVTYLELCKVYLRLDQPNTALTWYERAHQKYSYGDTQILLSMARVHDMLNDVNHAIRFYKQVLVNDASNVESIASLAAHHFYADQPEVALRFYRRLVQMGVNSAELWNNLGLCCFYSSQYDMTLSCFERALSIADDENTADIWHNIGQVAVSIGDIGQAYQAFKIALSIDSNHAESHCNIGVLEVRKGNIEQARSSYQTCQRLAPHMYEPFYNGAILAYKLGDFEESYDLVTKALQAYPEHAESKELETIITESLLVSIFCTVHYISSIHEDPREEGGKKKKGDEMVNAALSERTALSSLLETHKESITSLRECLLSEIVKGKDTEKEENALEVFQSFGNGFGDDICLLRYILSFHSVTKACEQALKAIKWRMQNRSLLESVYNGNELPKKDIYEKFHVAGLLQTTDDDGTQHLLRTRAGDLLFVMKVSLCDQSSLLKHMTVEEVINHTFYEKERMYLIMDELSRKENRLIKTLFISDWCGVASYRLLSPRLVQFLSVMSSSSVFLYPQFNVQNVICNPPLLLSMVISVGKKVMSKSSMEKVVICRGQSKSYKVQRNNVKLLNQSTAPLACPCPYLRQLMTGETLGETLRAFFTSP